MIHYKLPLLIFIAIDFTLNIIDLPIYWLNTGKSLIYLTPTSPTQNQVLYLKTKKAGDSFTVAIDQSIVTDIQFQYWIIN